MHYTSAILYHKYFEKMFPGCMPYVNADGICAHAQPDPDNNSYGDNGNTDTAIGDELTAFIDNFDAGMYPELIDPHWRTPNGR